MTGRESAPNAEVRSIRLDSLVPSPRNKRRRFEGLEELGKSLRAGQATPLTVRPLPSAAAGRVMFEIVYGERRYRAAELERLGSLECIVREMSEAEASAMRIRENDGRENLTPMEQAEQLAAHRDLTDCTLDDLHAVTGHSKGHLSIMLRVVDLPDEAKVWLDGGQLTLKHARHLLRITAAPDLVRRALHWIRDGLEAHGAVSTRALETEVKRLLESTKPAKPPRRPDPVPLVETLGGATDATVARVGSSDPEPGATVEISAKPLGGDSGPMGPTEAEADFAAGEEQRGEGPHTMPGSIMSTSLDSLADSQGVRSESIANVEPPAPPTPGGRPRRADGAAYQRRWKARQAAIAEVVPRVVRAIKAQAEHTVLRPVMIRTLAAATDPRRTEAGARMPDLLRLVVPKLPGTWGPIRRHPLPGCAESRKAMLHWVALTMWLGEEGKAIADGIDKRTEYHLNRNGGK